MSKYILTLLVLAYSLTAWSTSHEQIQKTAETVLDKLYKAHGNTLIQKPMIQVTDDETDAAVWKRRSNTIVLGKKAFEVCQTFGTDLKSALAFIIGHELAHAFQTDAHHTTSFLAHKKHPNAREVLEKQADVQGVLIAHLAGYRTVQLLPQIIDRIYEAYDLKHKHLYGYPSFEERQTTNDEVVALTKQLLEVFEAGNYLMAIGRYDLAASCFEYVEEYYQGVEVFNNLGVTYALRALNLSDKNVDPFLYPFEINWETRLRKPSLADGTKNLEPDIRRQWEKYLQKAEDSFEKVIQMAPQHKAKINRMAVMILRENYGTGPHKSHFMNWGDLSKVEASSISLLKGIAHAKQGNYSQAISIFRSLKQASNPSIAFQATYNLNHLTDNTNALANGFCPQDQQEAPTPILTTSKNITYLKEISLSESVHLQLDKVKVSGEVITQFSFFQNKKQVLTMKRYPNKTNYTATLPFKPENLQHALHTSSSIIVPCLKERVVYRVSKKDSKILERVYY